MTPSLPPPFSPVLLTPPPPPPPLVLPVTLHFLPLCLPCKSFPSIIFFHPILFLFSFLVLLLSNTFLLLLLLLLLLLFALFSSLLRFYFCLFSLSFPLSTLPSPYHCTLPFHLSLYSDPTHSFFIYFLLLLLLHPPSSSSSSSASFTIRLKTLTAVQPHTHTHTQLLFLFALSFHSITTDVEKSITTTLPQSPPLPQSRPPLPQSPPSSLHHNCNHLNFENR